jgi:hypothetical protein
MSIKMILQASHDRPETPDTCRLSLFPKRCNARLLLTPAFGSKISPSPIAGSLSSPSMINDHAYDCSVTQRTSFPFFLTSHCNRPEIEKTLSQNNTPLNNTTNNHHHQHPTAKMRFQTLPLLLLTLLAAPLTLANPEPVSLGAAGDVSHPPPPQSNPLTPPRSGAAPPA